MPNQYSAYIEQGKKRYNAHNANPLIGYISSFNTIETLLEGNTLVFRQTRISRLTLYLVMVTSLLIAYGLTQSPDFLTLSEFLALPLLQKVLYSIVTLGILALVLMALGFSVNKILRGRRASIEPIGAIRIYSGWPEQLEREVRPHELSDVIIEQVVFSGKYRTHTNHILILRLTSGEEVVLCGSPTKDIIDTIFRDIVRKTGIPQAGILQE